MSDQLLRALAADVGAEAPELGYADRLWAVLRQELGEEDESPPPVRALIPAPADPVSPERRVPAAAPVARSSRWSRRHLVAAAAAVAVMAACLGVLSTEDDHVLLPPAVEPSARPTTAPTPQPTTPTVAVAGLSQPGRRGPLAAVGRNADPVRPAAFPPPARPQAQPAVGWEVAYVDLGEGDSEIWTVRGDGSGRRRLTENVESDSAPAWSPDRRWIAQTSMRTEVSQLYLLEVSTGRVRHVPVDGCDADCSMYQPTWHPDGRHVLVTAGFRQVGCQAVGVYGDCAAILMVDVETGSSTRLGSGAYADVSPDGRRLVFEGSMDRDPTCDDATTTVAYCEGGELFVSDLAMTSVTPLGVRGSGAKWSPSGHQLLYLAVGETGRTVGNLTVLDLPSGTSREISTVAGLGDWLPDGSGFVCQVVEPDGEVDVHQVDLDGRLVRELASGPGMQLSVDVTS
jgi:hypothetical protein